MTRNLLFDPLICVKSFDQDLEKFDPHQLPFMSSIWPTLIISCIYLISLRVSERMMQARKAFQLKSFLAMYNITQVVFCVYFLINAFNAGLKIDYLWKCYLPGYNNLPHAKLLYLTYFIKALEFIETICFILRRNFRQVSFLHVYHHVSTFIFAYLGVTLVGNGMVMATYSLNMFIHAIMYSYYFASLFMRENQFVAVKKCITIMQMVQFCLILFNTLRSWQTDCGIENKFYYIFVLNVVIIFYQFYQFYKIAYSAKKLKNQKKRKSLKT
ncbi:unnamed protein product [Chironomus riparius]|uniref:Elongation of very long chain fatty acids protein n=1 Tax=Chironomus riparius TaxID=315576 RepID=A0A9N9WSU5_9DIPT|nr:unnamed protein product [Chironomus riparius]